MASIVSWERWKNRIIALKSGSISNPAWDSYLLDRHGIEMAFEEVHHQLRTRGRCPWPPRTAEQFRLYSFSSVAVRVYRGLSTEARRRFAGAVLSALEKEFGLAPLVFEMKTVAHLMNRGFEIDFHDLESGGGFDFLASRDGAEIEVECKHISADIGRQIHRRKLHELGGSLYPAMARALVEGHVRLLQVKLPGRLTNNNDLKQALSERVTAVLSGEAHEVNDPMCDISAQTFPLEASPFAANRGHDLTMVDIEYFLKVAFGIENAHVLLNWRPGQAAVLIHFHSATPDKVLGKMLKHLKADAKNQFSGCLPGFLCVHLADLNREQLLDLFETARSGTNTGIELAVNHLLERRPHLYGIALMADGEVRITGETVGRRVTTSIQEVGPSYIIRNSGHPLAGKALIDQMFA